MDRADLAHWQLRRDGFCVVPGVTPAVLLARIRATSARVVAGISAAHRAERRSTGSLIHVCHDPAYAELIACPEVIAALRALGGEDVRWHAGFVISKPPRSPALFWHQDWWAWHDAVSYTDMPAQVFVMHYLTDTRPENGCLRVIPGSHRRRHTLHDLDRAHSAELSRVSNTADPAYAAAVDEVAVPVRAGDLVIGDSRLLHATYANDSNEERTVITMWYDPNFRDLPAPIRARLVRSFHGQNTDSEIPQDHAGFPAMWPQWAQDLIAPLAPGYAGDVAPASWERQPGPALV